MVNHHFESVLFEISDRGVIIIENSTFGTLEASAVLEMKRGMDALHPRTSRS